MSAGLTESGKALGLPAEFSWRGKTYKVAAVDFDMECEFSAALIRQASEGLRRAGPSLGAAVFEAALRMHLDDLTCNEYDWSGRVGRKARESGAGCRELAWLCLTRHDPGFTRADLETLFRDTEKWNELMGVIRQLQEPPPNGSGPGGSAPPPGRPSGPPT
jgi:hypothetical protein